MNSWDAILSLNLERTPRRSWDHLGEVIAPYLPFLKPVGALTEHVSCERCGCNHEVVTDGSRGNVVAVCRCDEPTCADLELSYKEASLVGLDLAKLATELVKLLPMTHRAERIGGSAAWLIGEGTLRSDGKVIKLVACFSGNGIATKTAAIAISTAKLGRTIFVCKTSRTSEIEALLPLESHVVGFNDMWKVNSSNFLPGKSARRLLVGWDDEALAPLHSADGMKGYYFECSGQKKTKVNNEAYNLPLWRCWMDGRSFNLPNIVGSELIVQILMRRGETIFADALMRGLTGEAVDVTDEKDLDWIGEDETKAGSIRQSPDVRQELFDTQTFKDYQTRIKSLKTEINECGDDPTLAKEKALLEERLSDLSEHLKKNTRLGSNGTYVPKTFDDSLRKAANLVGKHIRKTLDQLHSIDRGLWEHLSDKRIFKFGQTCSYDAEEGYPWQKK